MPLSQAEAAAKKKAEKDAEKAAKAAAAPAKKKSAEEEEDELDANQYKERRQLFVKHLEQAGTTAYPHKFHVDTTLPSFHEQYASCPDGEKVAGASVAVAGRVLLARGQGKLRFYDLHADGVKIQVMTDPTAYTAGDEQAWLKVTDPIRRGDILGVKGTPGKSKKGELSIFPTEIVLLSPCLHMLPKGLGSLKDPEVRFRQRYVDLIVTPSSRSVFETRAKIINYVRRFLDMRHFLEVETPMMNVVHGGATAKPFVTFHNELQMYLYMRVAPELYLKQLVIGGLDRVYEIGRQFRNEGMDLTHNPEFTTCEFYQAYADYEDLMNMTEELVSEMVREITGGYKISYAAEEGGEAVEIDFSPPWPRVPMIEGLEKELNVTFPTDLTTEATRLWLEQLCAKHGVECSPPRTTARLIDKLVGDFLEEKCIHPTFIMEHPQIMSPLAKYHRSKPGLTERFELFCCKRELCNAYTELNNPEVQRACFASQATHSKGDDEAMVKDEDFCTALEYGLAPTGGWGMGIDRLTMFLTNNASIREVLLFPLTT